MKELICVENCDPLFQQIRLGLCCMNSELRTKNIFCSRTVTRKNFTVEKAQQLALKNISDIKTLLEWNIRNDINVFRLSSDIFPHFTDSETEKYDMDFAIPLLRDCGEFCNTNLQRITMHPGQYNQVGARDRAIFEKTIEDLSMHCDMLDYMGIDTNNGIVNIHGGGLYGDKEKTKRRWVEQFSELPQKVKNRLTIENCEKCFNVRDCLDISRECKIPVVLDTHHYNCYGILHPDEVQENISELIPEVLESWGNDRIPLFHISEQKPNSPVGSHSDFVEEIPKYLLDIPILYDRCIDIDIEAKAKEKAILRLYDKYPNIFKM